MSQTELAGKIGVSYQQVQKYEKGISDISFPRLERIASALNVPIRFFLDDNGWEMFGEEVKLILLFRKIKNESLKSMLFKMLDELAG